ncbi:Glycosyltransferase involved in cell wall bisynthesis (RfaB) (PDB:2IV7) [Commensalibacter communis]|uniref:FkbM family methyltransferase n=1 Tax=Commensalibacter communis TaxID=2972786 RepID=UPI0022FFC21E|nr:FkbM family methyltransferase [Commensalibacter communis]CAI3960817.1 Glycosyltransferase involved in cell wall bisynthesis (RfaB) (PDB:2IV7) [Commensalibacter communis]CAI3961695.1 Glycosyltransferase involved in cell wall bisynthesis (RfaB) (PDB:2IV7) [Commensalibacter communis]
MMQINNFLTLDCKYGKFIINRHCHLQAEHIVKKGVPHIQSELDNILFLISSLPDQPVIFDVGANAGLVSIPIAQTIKSRGGIVHAFEPQKMLYYALCGSVALNDLENVTVHNKGVGEKASILYLNDIDYSKDQDFGEVFLIETEGKNRVEIVCLDDLGVKRLDFLKIDVEGMEVPVIKGASKTIAQYRPYCWVEYWKVGFENIIHLFEDDYAFFIMDELNILCAPKEKIQSLNATITVKQVFKNT